MNKINHSPGKVIIVKKLHSNFRIDQKKRKKSNKRKKRKKSNKRKKRNLISW
jgi:hypothetical protein